jgi:hypothetical protein
MVNIGRINKGLSQFKQQILKNGTIIIIIII